MAAQSAAMQPSLQHTLRPVTVKAARLPVMLQAAQPLGLQEPVTRVKPVRMQLPMAGVGRVSSILLLVLLVLLLLHLLVLHQLMGML